MTTRPTSSSGARGSSSAAAPTRQLPADDYNRAGVRRTPTQSVRLRRRAPLRDVRGLRLGTLAITGPTINLTPFPAIGGPRGPMYLAFHSGRREHWGHVDAVDLASRPSTSSRNAAGNGRRPPPPHDTLFTPDGRRLSYYVRPRPIRYELLYKNSRRQQVAARTAGPSFRNYGAYEGPSGNGAYRTERPDADRHHQPLVWSTVRRATGRKVDGGGVAKAFLSDGDVFYRANVQEVTIEACSAAFPCSTDDGERPPVSGGSEGRVRFVYGYVWGSESGRQYGWTVHSWQVGPLDSPMTYNLELTSPDLEEPPEQPPTLRRGDRGTWVRRLQQRLTMLAASRPELDPGGVDGIFGPRTERAVRAFQRAEDLSVDGVVGPRTWEALDG